MRTSIALILCLVAGVVVAQGVYRSIDSEGNVAYSDQPTAGAKEVELQPVQGYEPPPVPEFSTSDSNEADGQAATRGYEHFAVVSPAQDDTVRNSQGAVDVAVDLRPPLQRGDTLRLLLDGEPIKDMTGTIARLDNIDRGTHTVSAKVVADSGKVIATTAPVTFYLHRTFALAN